MQDINDTCEFNSVDSAVCIAVMILHNFQNTCTVKPVQWFGIIGLHTCLSEAQCETHSVPDRRWQRHEFIESTTYPFKRLVWKWR